MNTLRKIFLNIKNVQAFFDSPFVQLGADVELPLARRLLELEHDVHVGDRLVGAAAIFLQGLEDFAEATFAFALHDVELHVVGNSDDRIRLHVGHAAI